MDNRNRPWQAVFSLLAVLCVLLASLPVHARPQIQSGDPPSSSQPASPGAAAFRTRVALRQPRDMARLQELGVAILDEQAGSATVLADAEQLEALARLRFAPQGTDEVGALVSAHAASKPWLAEGLKPLLAEAAAAQERLVTAAAVPEGTLTGLRAELGALGPELQAGVAGLTSLDDDGDGLTNTQEQWWCTDPLDPDTDGDGADDGAEVGAAKDWLANAAASYPSTGKPFAGWPPDIAGCQDDDQDSVPDLAERWDLGLNMNRESTDRDKFDDGQELFGNTYCPGSGGFCGYGALPRNEDWGVIFAEMPSWVEAPGDHPLVAAFPVPEVDVAESSLRVETVTTVTTDHTITEGEERSYSTAKTEGASTSVANTQTWNEWQEVSIATPQESIRLVLLRPIPNKPSEAQGDLFGMKMAGGTLAVLGAIGGVACTVATGGLCLPLAVAGLAGASLALGADMIEHMDEAQDRAKANACDPDAPYLVPKCLQAAPPVEEQLAIDLEAQNAPTQDRTTGRTETRYSIAAGDQTTAQSIYHIEYPQPRQVPVVTNTSGKAVGGAQTTTTEQYEAHTITNGEAFSNSEAWGTATAVNSSHAADLWFTYQVRNPGTEYAREICDLAFNIYIGDDPNPTYTYHVGPDLGGDGCFHNFMPDEEHEYASQRIALSLEQMKAVDLGGPMRVVVEDYSYGIDELFYEDAASSSLLVAMEDGTADGDEAVDTYLIPTWGEEAVLDVLARYFPHTADGDGNLLAIWTPEYRADTPAWCDGPQRVGTTLWCRHALSTADWWNVYTDGLGDGSEGFQDTLAAPGSVALFRFNRDSDLDGYRDRSEERLGTDPDDPSDHPRPELIAGVHSSREGDHVTTTLSLLNTGLYDAYGVEAVMIAPTDAISITNNTVGGSGRVRALHSVVVGSRVLPPDTEGTWQSTAVPQSAGYYEGTADRTYTFTAQCGLPGGCEVGAGTWTLAWDDGAGANGTLNFDDGYASPTFLGVGALGVEVALLSGTVQNGDTFTVEARTPRDTFQYDILQEPYSEPVVLISYNDPQGNHRFVTPVALGHPTDDLATYSGQMLQNPGVEIVTTEAFVEGANTTDLVVNNPTEATLVDAHLFLEFVDPEGTVVREEETTATIEPGPSIVPIAWDSGDFSPPFVSDQDYIVMAFWTDYQGNILDTAARPLSSFQADPKPAFAMAAAAAVWDFGTAAQGTVMKRTFTLANTGFLDLLTYVDAPAGMDISQQGSRRVGPADATSYEITLKTAEMPLGPYQETITIRTSDPEQAVQTVIVQGTVTEGPSDAPGGAVLRPLDWEVYIDGDHSAGEWWEFTHTLGPDPQSLHPVKVYSQDYTNSYGVGKYATDFRQGTASAAMFGDGRDGDLVVPPGPAVAINTARASVSASGTSAAPSNSTGFSVGDLVLFHQTQQTGNVGRWELNTIAAINGPNDWTLTSTLQYVYDSVNGRAQVIKVPQYRNVTVQSGATLAAPTWDGTTGGILVFFAKGILDISGTISAKGTGGSSGPPPGVGTGYAGGTAILASPSSYNVTSYTGEGTTGTPTQAITANGNGGGAGHSASAFQSGGCGGGGGNGTAGGTGDSADAGGSGGAGGGTSGSADLTSMTFGGGGGGAAGANIGAPGGGAGGGIAFISAATIAVGAAGSATANGGGGGQSALAGGSGAGGSILLKCQTATLGSSQITATGGPATAGTAARTPPYHGGAGGAGLIRIEYCESLTGTTNPPASTQKVECYIVEQVESAPYDHARLNLPESFTGGRTYKVQFGRRYEFAAAGAQVKNLQLTRQMYGTASLDILVSNTGVSSGDLDLCLDVGNDGDCEYSHSGATDFPVELEATGLAEALNAYLLGLAGVAWGDPADVPVRVQVDPAVDVMLTNLALTPVGAKTRFVRLPALALGEVTIDLQFGQAGDPSGPLAFTADVGADGVVDWSEAGEHDYPAAVTSPNLAAAFNAYLAGRTGEVDVPLRIVPSPFLATSLEGFSATPASQPDVTLAAGDIAFGASSPTEGEAVAVTATLHNDGGLDSGGLTAAFYAEAPGWGDWYVGSAYVPEVPAGGTAQVEITWNTLGFTGTVPVRVAADPYDRVGEADEENNEASTTLEILTRPDLLVAELALSDGEPVAGEMVSVTLMLRNRGQTAAGEQEVGLYDGNPEAGGSPIGSPSTTGLGGGAEATITFPWTPASPGPYRLFARADGGDAVDEYDEGNNLSWRDVYVGLAGPIAMDSGGDPDPAYTAELGYGHLNPGSWAIPCGPGSEGSLRADAGTLYYRFDHLLPGHYYHLDVTLRDCDGNRAEEITIDDTLAVEAVDLGDHRPHRLSILVDPAFYTDHTITVGVADIYGLGGRLADIALHDVDYRYADAGACSDCANDPAYPAPGAERPYGWLDGALHTEWGTLPHESIRIDWNDPDPADDPDSELRYRFDALDPARSYQLHLSFRQLSGATVAQKVQVDGLDASPGYDIDHGQVYSVTLAVPLQAYEADGSIEVGILRVDCATSEAFVNQIALEEETLAAGSICEQVRPTPERTVAWGSVTIEGEPAPAGTVVQAVTLRGDVAGCFLVLEAGQYGYMSIFGEDPGVIPGMREGEIVEFRVNGVPAVTAPSLYWTNDQDLHQVELAIGAAEAQCSWLQPEWNLVSFAKEPPVPVVESVLRSVEGRYCRVLGEAGIYDCDLDPVYRTLQEMHPGEGYYLRLDTGLGANLRMIGVPVPVTTAIPLHEGWNWAGYLPTATLPITVALASIEGQYDLVHGLKETFNPADPGHSYLRQMERGQGYLIRATEVVSLTYPAGAGQAPALQTVTEPSPCGGVSPTPSFTLVYGAVTLGGQPAPPGTVVEVLTPRDEVAGCFVVWRPGDYGYARAYGADNGDPPIPGFQRGEVLRFRVNGVLAEASIDLTWASDLAPHEVDLAVDTHPAYLPLILRE